MERQTPETFPKIDADGHLYNPGEWNAGVAEELARRRGIALTSAHWAVLNDLRDYYFRFGSAQRRALARSRLYSRQLPNRAAFVHGPALACRPLPKSLVRGL